MPSIVQSVHDGEQSVQRQYVSGQEALGGEGILERGEDILIEGGGSGVGVVTHLGEYLGHVLEDVGAIEATVVVNIQLSYEAWCVTELWGGGVGGGGNKVCKICM